MLHINFPELTQQDSVSIYIHFNLSNRPTRVILRNFSGNGIDGATGRNIKDAYIISNSVTSLSMVIGIDDATSNKRL